MGRNLLMFRKIIQIVKNYIRLFQRSKMFVDETIDPWNTGSRRRPFEGLRHIQGMRSRRKPHTISRKRNIFVSFT